MSADNKFLYRLSLRRLTKIIGIFLSCNVYFKISDRQQLLTDFKSHDPSIRVIY